MPLWQSQLAAQPDNVKLCRDEYGRLTICPGGITARDINPNLMRNILYGRITGYVNKVAQVIPDYQFVFGDAFEPGDGWVNTLTITEAVATAEVPATGILCDNQAWPQLGRYKAYELGGQRPPVWCDRGICYVRTDGLGVGPVAQVRIIGDYFQYRDVERDPRQLFDLYCGFEEGEACGFTVGVLRGSVWYWYARASVSAEWSYEGKRSLEVEASGYYAGALLRLANPITLERNDLVTVHVAVDGRTPAGIGLCIVATDNRFVCMGIARSLDRLLFMYGVLGQQHSWYYGYVTKDFEPGPKLLSLTIGFPTIGAFQAFVIWGEAYEINEYGLWEFIKAPVIPRNYLVDGPYRRPAWSPPLTIDRIVLAPCFGCPINVRNRAFYDSLRLWVSRGLGGYGVGGLHYTRFYEEFTAYVPWIELGLPLTGVAAEYDFEELLAAEASFDGEQTWEPLPRMQLVDLSLRQPTGFALRFRFKGMPRGWALLAR